MNIEKYLPFFHDGSVIAITHDNNEIIISMESSEISNGQLNEKYVYPIAKESKESYISKVSKKY